MIYTITLNPSIDYTVFPSVFSAGEINRSEYEVYSFGGKGINVSAMLSNLGVENIALGFVGGFSGKEIERLARLSGIKTDFCEISENSRINVKIVSDTESAVNGKGPFIRIEEEDALIEKLMSLSEEDTVVLSGSAPDSESGELLRKVTDASCKARLIVDMSGKALSYAVGRKPYMIKPNLDELCELSGKTDMDDDEIIKAISDIRRGGVENVLLSLGERGAILAADDGNIYKMRAPKIDVCSTVGAGDSFLAGFLAGESRGKSFALALAVAAGSATAASEKIADAAEVMNVFSQM